MRILTILALLALVACDSNTKQWQQQESMNQQAVDQNGMPAITRFSEMKQLKTIYELRDEAITTTTYIVDLYGKLHKICDSIGYGIPYSTQYSPPGEHNDNREPNGLFPPAAADGTWVLCLDPATKKTWPLYVEPRVVVSPFVLHVQ